MKLFVRFGTRTLDNGLRIAMCKSFHHRDNRLHIYLKNNMTIWLHYTSRNVYRMIGETRGKQQYLQQEKDLHMFWGNQNALVYILLFLRQHVQIPIPWQYYSSVIQIAQSIVRILCQSWCITDNPDKETTCCLLYIY